MTSALLAVTVYSGKGLKELRKRRTKASQARLVERLSSADKRLPLCVRTAKDADLLAAHCAEKEISESQGEIPLVGAMTPSTAGKGEQERFPLFVRVAHVETYAVDVTPSATGAELQSAAASVLGPAARRGTFSFSGQELALDQPLADFGVGAESIVEFTSGPLWSLQELEEHRPIFEAEFVVGDHSQSVFLQFQRYCPFRGDDPNESVHHFLLMKPNPPGYVGGPGFYEIAVSDFRLFECPAGIAFTPLFDLSEEDDGSGLFPSHHDRFPFDVAFGPASCVREFYDDVSLDYTVTFNEVVHVERKSSIIRFH